MDSTKPKMYSITGGLIPNKLTEREDNFTFNAIYLANRTIKNLCKLAAVNSKFSASGLESAYNEFSRMKNRVVLRSIIIPPL